MTGNEPLMLTAFLGVSSLVLLVFALVGGRRGRMDARLLELTNKDGNAFEDAGVKQLAKTALPKIATPLVPQDQEERTRLQTRLVQAGLYNRQAMMIFLGAKMLLIAIPIVVGFSLFTLHLSTVLTGLLVAACGSIIGLIGPSFWLDKRKKDRQTRFRRALPDALDVLVICLEGGLSLPGSLRRVAEELQTAYPELAMELSIAEKEIQLGRSTGEALRQFGERADLEEIRSLAAVILQTEKYGASLVKALRVHAETLRTKRMHHAEEMAQKAVIKILFPTLICIFPGIFIVILGPGIYQLIETWKF